MNRVVKLLIKYDTIKLKGYLKLLFKYDIIKLTEHFSFFFGIIKQNVSIYIMGREVV